MACYNYAFECSYPWTDLKVLVTTSSYKHALQWLGSFDKHSGGKFCTKPSVSVKAYTKHDTGGDKRQLIY